MSDRPNQTEPYGAREGTTRSTYTAVPVEPERVVVPDDVDKTDEIRSDIAQTQAEMSETINAIGERLSPQHLMEQARDTVREATIGKAEQMVNSAGDTARGAGSSIMETIRENPVPAAMAALGLGWLIMKRSQRSPGGSPRYRYQSGSAPLGSMAAPQAQNKAGQLADQAQSQVSQLGAQAQDQAQAVVAQTRYQAQRAQGQLQRVLQENPLAVGAAAIAAGAAVGLAIPATRQENQLMGEARDNLMGQAQATAQQTMQKVQRVAQEAAQNEGLVG